MVTASETLLETPAQASLPLGSHLPSRPQVKGRQWLEQK